MWVLLEDNHLPKGSWRVMEVGHQAREWLQFVSETVAGELLFCTRQEAAWEDRAVLFGSFRFTVTARYLLTSDIFGGYRFHNFNH